MKEPVILLLKGAAMGAANVIPGVSGGTVAFITGIYERLINALKSIDLEAARLLFGGRFRQFAEKIDFWFLLWLGAGIVVSIVSLAKILEVLLVQQRVLVFAFFFGLILASVYFVGKQVKHWKCGTIAAMLLGAGVAIGVALLNPARENSNFFYLVLCGVIGTASMIIPGLSGSFVLLLMGNYKLVMIDSVSALSSGDLGAFGILLPVGLGAILGLFSLSHLLSWVFRHYHDIAVALLTGFVAGSLLVIWPWKTEKTVEFTKGTETVTEVVGYDPFLPAISTATLLALLAMASGATLVWLMERFGEKLVD